jgi:hypothetical protein
MLERVREITKLNPMKAQLINLIATHVHLNIEFIDDICEIENEIELPELLIAYKFTAECDTMHEEETNYTHVDQYGETLQVTCYNADGNEIELPFGITTNEIIDELKKLI